MPSPLSRPMGNAYDRTHNYLSVTGPSPQAGQYTTNVNGSQTAQAPVQRTDYSSHVPGQKRAWGDYPQQVPGQPYYSPQTRAIMQTPGYQDRQARALAAGPAEIEPSLSFQQQSANVDRFQNQQMAAINGSQAFQNGPDPKDLAKWYSAQAKDRFAMSPGGANMIQRAQQMSSLAGGISPAGLSQGQQYAADMAAGQQTLENNYTGDGTAGPNGLYVSHVGGRGLALTSGGNARYQAENGAPYQGGGGMMNVDENGSEIMSPTEGKNYLQIQADTLPEYRGNAARNALRTQSRREANGGLSDRQIRRNEQKMLELNRGIKRGALTAGQAEARYNSYLGGSKPADAKMVEKEDPNYLIKVSETSFAGPGVEKGKAYLDALSSPTAENGTIQDMQILKGFKISPESSGRQFVYGVQQNIDAINKASGPQKLEMAKALYKFAHAKVVTSDDDNDWAKSSDFLNDGSMFSILPSVDSAAREIRKVADINPDDENELLRWLQDVSRAENIYGITSENPATATKTTGNYSEPSPYEKNGGKIYGGF